MASKTTKNCPMTINDFIRYCQNNRIDMDAIIASPEGQFIFEGFDILEHGKI